MVVINLICVLTVVGGGFLPLATSVNSAHPKPRLRDPNVYGVSRSFWGTSPNNLLTELVHMLSSVIHKGLVESATTSAERSSATDKRTPRQNDEDKKAKDGLYYHYYPHYGPHHFNLPECATQQVCNAVYLRLNLTQHLCTCPSLSNPCSASFLSNDEHTIELKMDRASSKAVTLVKTCESVTMVRECRQPKDWSLLALQNTRTGKAHYLVICKCPESAKLEGPLNHDQPTYAQVPGIRVYGMMCTYPATRYTRDTNEDSAEELARWSDESAIERGNIQRLFSPNLH